MIKRTFDIVMSFVGIVVGSVILLPTMVAVWLGDFKSPFYIAPRAARGGGTFRMVKLRSMTVNAAKIGGASTAGDDRRVTSVGKFIRRAKLDELMQLFNVLLGRMSFVGPRPQVPVEAAAYTAEERRLLSVRPGITDLASIVFADEGEILRGASDPDLRYNQVIQPWKSRLGLLYVDTPPSLVLDVRLIVLTLLSALNRRAALDAVSLIVRDLLGGDELVRIARRTDALPAAPPPGATEVVTVAPR